MKSVPRAEQPGDGTAAPAPECQLCRRVGVTLTKHHLIPRMRHRAKRTQREYAQREMQTHVLWVCRPCHDHIHAVLTEKELAAGYSSPDALRAHPEIERFVRWVRNKPSGLTLRSRAMKRRPGRRRSVG